jgi:uncharacterized protein (TIGR00266 family)
MQIDIRHSPSFAVARLGLGPGEAAKAESGAMLAMSDGVGIEAGMQGGLMKSLRRGILGGESFFMTTFTAPEGGGWVDVAPALPGDVAILEVTAEMPLIVDRGSFLAGEAGLEIDSKWKGFKSLFGGEGGFMVHAGGHGSLVVSSYGAIDRVTLGEGERMIVDTGHMVAFPDSIEWKMRRAADGKTITSMKSGELFVFEFVGPGTILTQTRSFDGLVAMLRPELGTRE